MFFFHLFKTQILLGVIILKQLYKSWASWVHRHAGSIAFILPFLIIGLLLLFAHWRGVQDEKAKPDTRTDAKFVYDKPLDVIFVPCAGIMYEPEGLRGFLGIEIAYIRPFHIDLIGSIPVFEEVDLDRTGVGLGVSTPVRENFFIGAGWNKEIFHDDQREFWAVYGKVRF